MIICKVGADSWKIMKWSTFVIKSEKMTRDGTHVHDPVTCCWREKKVISSRLHLCSLYKGTQGSYAQANNLLTGVLTSWSKYTQHLHWDYCV